MKNIQLIQIDNTVKSFLIFLGTLLTALIVLSLLSKGIFAAGDQFFTDLESKAQAVQSGATNVIYIVIAISMVISVGIAIAKSAHGGVILGIVTMHMVGMFLVYGINSLLEFVKG